MVRHNSTSISSLNSLLTILFLPCPSANKRKKLSGVDQILFRIKSAIKTLLRQLQFIDDDTSQASTNTQSRNRSKHSRSSVDGRSVSSLGGESNISDSTGMHSSKKKVLLMSMPLPGLKEEEIRDSATTTTATTATSKLSTLKSIFPSKVAPVPVARSTTSSTSGLSETDDVLVTDDAAADASCFCLDHRMSQDEIDQWSNKMIKASRRASFSTSNSRKLFEALTKEDVTTLELITTMTELVEETDDLEDGQSGQLGNTDKQFASTQHLERVDLEENVKIDA